jgi:hypothetical protein
MRALQTTGPRSASARLARKCQVHHAPRRVPSPPKSMSSHASGAPVDALASTVPSQRPGIAAGVKSATTVSASDMRNWTIPNARMLCVWIATTEATPYTAAINPPSAT